MSTSGPLTPKWGMTLTFPESTEAGKGASSAAFAEFGLGAPPRKSATSLRETFCTVLIQVVDSLAPLGFVGFVQDEKWLWSASIPSNGGVRSAALTGESGADEGFRGRGVG